MPENNHPKPGQNKKQYPPIPLESELEDWELNDTEGPERDNLI